MQSTDSVELGDLVRLKAVGSLRFCIFQACFAFWRRLLRDERRFVLRVMLGSFPFRCVCILQLCNLLSEVSISTECANSIIALFPISLGSLEDYGTLE